VPPVQPLKVAVVNYTTELELDHSCAAVHEHNNVLT